MSSFLARILYRKKVKRLEKLTQALQKIGEGNLRAAMALVHEVRPTEYTEDLGLYFFVKGRLAMELLELEKGEAYLTTAWALGFRKGAVFVSLAVAKGRLRKLGEARELLSIGRQYLSSDDDDHKLIDQLENLLDMVAQGSARRQVSEIFTAEAKQVGVKTNPRELKERDWQKLLERLVGGAREKTPTDEMVAVLGSYMVAKHQGVWEYGLEITDHAVLVNGVAYRPVTMLRSYFAGTITIDDFSKVLPEQTLSGLFLEEEGLA